MSEPPVPPDRPCRPVPEAHEEARGGAPENTRGPEQHEGDAGLFGPGSVTWRVHAEPLMGVAGLRALLLQALHPVVMAGFEEHSTSRDDLTRLLAGIAEYVAVTTYGSTTEAMLVASRVRAIHARVHGVLPTGVTYAAEDPQLLAWVHCCLVASFLEVVTRGGLVLTGAEQDGYIAEQVKAAMLVGLEPDEVPHDRAALQDYFRVIRPALECTPAARRAAAGLLAAGASVHGLAAPQRPARADAGCLAFAALPPWGRRLYALPELPGTAGLPDAATTLELRSLRAALRGAQAVPPPLVVPPLIPPPLTAPTQLPGRHLRAAPAHPEQ